MHRTTPFFSTARSVCRPPWAGVAVVVVVVVVVIVVSDACSTVCMSTTVKVMHHQSLRLIL